jgi:hypothetical protein
VLHLISIRWVRFEAARVKSALARCQGGFLASLSAGMLQGQEAFSIQRSAFSPLTACG